MASVTKLFTTLATADQVWEVIRDVGALHSRLVPGFVVATRMEGSTRVVTFGNGAVVREPILCIDDTRRRVAWTAEGGLTTHYNSAVQVLVGPGGATQVIWTSDFLPDSAETAIDAAMKAGSQVMKKTLDKLAAD